MKLPIRQAREKIYQAGCESGSDALNRLADTVAKNWNLFGDSIWGGDSRCRHPAYLPTDRA